MSTTYMNANKITQASMTPTCLRLYDEDTGTEWLFARAHMALLVYNGTELRVYTTNSDLHTYPFVRHPDYVDGRDEIGNDMDRVVSAFATGAATDQ